MADDFGLDTMYCTFCGAPKLIVELVDHIGPCGDAKQGAALTGVADAADAALARLFVDIHPRVAYGPARAGDVAVDARDATEIIPGLWLGNTVAAKNTAWLAATGIKGIVNCANEITPIAGAELEASGVEHIVTIHLHDDEEAEKLPASFEHIVSGATAVQRLCGDADAIAPEVTAPLLGVPPAQAAYTDAECGATLPRLARPVLVHCAFGRSRSASILLAYLTAHRGLPLAAAYKLVKARRPIMLPNFGFVASLAAMEEARTGAPCTLPDHVLVLHPAGQRQFELETGRRLRENPMTRGLRVAREHAARRGAGLAGAAAAGGST